MPEITNFDVLRIAIASPEQIRSWSRGEVKKPETINYRTFKPERDGLFCERIFGPVRDWECHCGKYKKIKFKGIICDRCGVEVTRSKVRRRRMGHIELAAPCCHIWYLKGVPSPLSLLLDMPARQLEKVIYFASYIVTFVDRERIDQYEQEIEGAMKREEERIHTEKERAIAALQRQLKEAEMGVPEEIEVGEELAEGEEGESGMLSEEELERQRAHFQELIDQEERNAEEAVEELHLGYDLLQQVQEKQLLNDTQYRLLTRFTEMLGRQIDSSFIGIVRAGLGAEAVRELLVRVDLDELAKQLRQESQDQSSQQRRSRAIKRLQIVEAFRKSGNRPEWMILEVIPVLPPDLRPMVQLDGGRFAASDLNDLYRRIINRNNRLQRI
ncbi:MAG TPA: DNA-directed RNA polymerase subunit beta', partial [Armatimonadetes bacterium]|nr:DNA-directed RNA polymerase subunit beta' [Armatimonadota bacterium]